MPVPGLRERKADLDALLAAGLTASLYTNRYALHPRRVRELAPELAAEFLSFTETGSPDARARGAALAREGLGERTILVLATIVRTFCRPSTGAAADAETMDAAERWTSGIVEGFLESSQAMILSDQEQLRRALSTALGDKTRELLVKNHAINTSINGIMLTDLDGAITWVNASFLALCGYETEREVVGLPWSAVWTAEEARRLVDRVQAVGGWRGELAALRRDGSTFPAELSASLIRNEDATGIGLMASFVDATERRRLEAQVIQAQKMEALGHLAGGITHDFNNLLTVISGYLQILRDDVPPDSPMHHDLEQVNVAVNRGAGLTRQLRFFTRQATGTRQVVSLNDVARETVEILRRAFPPEISLELSCTPDLGGVEADPNQLSQVLVNLCVNARDAMMDARAARGGRRLRLATANVVLSEPRVGRYMSAPAGRWVSVTVRDNGIGMPPALLDRLFVPFVTTKTPRSGTGMGLAVVYGIVTAHNGFIDVRSDVGSGSVFEILLPRSARDPEKAAASAEAPAAHGHGRVLVVDDEPSIREIMIRVLAEAGFSVESAGDGQRALELYGDGRRFDLVVLDVVMPGMGGRECLRRMRETNPDARVLVSTGFTSDGSAQELIAEGAAAMVEKPLDLRAFLQTVLWLLAPAGG